MVRRNGCGPLVGVLLFRQPYRPVVGEVLVPLQCSAVEGVVDLVKRVVVDVESVQVRRRTGVHARVVRLVYRC